MTDHPYLQSLRIPTQEKPWRILMSACLAGDSCGYDGTTNGIYATVEKLKEFPEVQIIPFCPEAFSFGSPREMCDIHGGTGADVLDGHARVLSDSGLDWTEGMIQGAQEMLRVARKAEIELAVMMDISAACGSQVIYSGNRFAADKRYQIGMGVAAELLTRNGYRVISQRDFAAWELLWEKLIPGYARDASAVDHDQTEWYQNYFSPF